MILLALIWGGSFSSNRVALMEVGPLTAVAFRVTIAAALLGAWVWWRGLPLPSRLPWFAMVFIGIGLMGNALPFAMILWAQQHIPSGLAGILNAGSGIFAVLLVAAIFPDERLTARRAFGVAITLLGIVVTTGLGMLAHLDPMQAAQLVMLGAGLCHAVAMVLARLSLCQIHPMVAAAGLLAGAATTAVPAALWVEGMPTMHYAPQTWGALAYLAVAGSALAYVLYFRILVLAGPGNLSLVPLMVVPTAILLGGVLFGEVLAPSAYVGFAVMAIGLMVIDGRAFRRPAFFA